MRAGARTGYVIPGRDGNGGCRFEEILPPSSPPSSSPPSTPKSRVFGEIAFLRFVTHSRAMNFLASAYESYGRGGSFFFINSWKTDIFMNYVEIYEICLKNLRRSQTCDFVFGAWTQSLQSS